MTTTLEASAHLHHLHFASPNPGKLAEFYADVMDMTVELADGGFIARGPARRIQFSAGPTKTLLHAGFALRDQHGLDQLRLHARDEKLNPKAASTPFFRDGAFNVVDPDGNTILFGLAAPEAPTSDRLVRGPLQHLTLATRNVQAIEDFYVGKLGFGLSDRVVDKDGRVTTAFMRGNHEHHNLACFLQDRQGVDHHSYEAGEWDTIRDWSDRFAARGVQLMWGPGRHGPGDNLFIFIVDPDGNWIEVSAELEVVHDRPVKSWPHEPRTLNLWGPAILRT
jgi:catechol 2,3-dioxygenase-like lactoylglutathione lyase family enzyme